MAIHAKVLELKQRAGFRSTASTVNIQTQANLPTEQLDKGIVEGYMIIWNQRSQTGLKFLKGCCGRSITEHGPASNADYKIKFLNQHNTDDPLSLFDELVEDGTGLRFRTKPLDDWQVQGSPARRVITQLKSGTLNNFSHGFDFVWDKTEYDDNDDSIVCAEIQLFEGSVVTIPAGLNTRRIASLDELQLEDVHDDIASFIKTLPSKYRMQARELFTLQNSLIDFDTVKKNAITVQQKPSDRVKKGIDYKYLLQNL
jgi:HK97 family phage prohead protease